jgi:phospholipid transport system transporter-binding protein
MHPRAPQPKVVKVETVSPDRFSVSGGLTFATARRALEAGEKHFAETDAKSIAVDCKDVTASDSAGLAVLLDWVAQARRAGRTIHFEHLPEQILAVAAISEVEDLLA